MPGTNDFTVRFLGVRGSYPAPGAATARGGGHTTCHEVRAGDHRIVLDAGTGIIALGDELIDQQRQDGQPVRLTLLFTHLHHDHVYGLLYFRPAYLSATRVWIGGPTGGEPTLRDALCGVIRRPFHPLPLDAMGMKASCHELVGGERLRLKPGATEPELIGARTRVRDGEVLIRVCVNPGHSADGVLHYRIEYRGRAYVFATDIEAGPDGDPVLARFAAGADLLAHDAQYTDEEYDGTVSRRGWGHSTWRTAIATAKRAGVSRLALIHHDPTHDDTTLDRIERAARRTFRGAFAAREGQTVRI